MLKKRKKKIEFFVEKKIEMIFFNVEKVFLKKWKKIYYFLKTNAKDQKKE